MDLTKTLELFENLRTTISEHRGYLSGNETVTRVLLIDPVLEILGWEVRNPDFVELEFEPATSKRDKADYILRNGSNNVAIVEAKRFGAQVDELAQREQADGYARYAGVRFFVLTDGSKWRLYERDLLTSIEVLKPVVQFDLDNDELTKCALTALSLWRANLGSGSKPTMASEPILIPTGPEHQLKIGHEPQETTIESTSQIDNGWKSLTSLTIGSRAKPPAKLLIGGEDIELPPYNDKRPMPAYSNWTGFLVCFAKWLVASGKLDRTKCPITINAQSDLSLIADKPEHPSGSQFHASEEIGGGLWINKNLSTPNKLRALIHLLKSCGIDPDSVYVDVN